MFARALRNVAQGGSNGRCAGNGNEKRGGGIGEKTDVSEPGMQTNGVAILFSTMRFWGKCGFDWGGTRGGRVGG